MEKSTEFNEYNEHIDALPEEEIDGMGEEANVATATEEIEDGVGDAVDMVLGAEEEEDDEPFETTGFGD